MIETKDLRAGYGGREVLHGVSLAFPPGRVTAIAGPNGCGKSTLLRAVLGMVQHMGGQVLFDGVPAEELSAGPSGSLREPLQPPTHLCFILLYRVFSRSSTGSRNGSPSCPQ